MREGLVREDDGNGGCGEVGVGVWRWVGEVGVDVGVGVGVVWCGVVESISSVVYLRA